VVAPEIGTSTLTTDFGWNEASGRYINLSTGQFVPFSEIRDALELVMDTASARMDLLTQKLIDGDITLASWQRGMMDNIKLSHTAATAASRGGWAAVSQSDWGAAGQMIRGQYDYLRNFAAQIADGTQPLDGRSLVRAGMYGDASRGTFEEQRRRGEILIGMEEERRVLGAADHCDDCLDAADEGWQPIGTLPAIGDSVCHTNCHCAFEYRRAGEESDE